MRLGDWIIFKKSSVGELAVAAKKPYETVRRHVLGLRVPNEEMMIFYSTITNGEVTPNDFYPLTHIKQPVKPRKRSTQ